MSVAGFQSDGRQSTRHCSRRISVPRGRV